MKLFKVIFIGPTAFNRLSEFSLVYEKCCTTGLWMCDLNLSYVLYLYRCCSFRCGCLTRNVAFHWVRCHMSLAWPVIIMCYRFSNSVESTVASRSQGTCQWKHQFIYLYYLNYLYAKMLDNSGCSLIRVIIIEYSKNLFGMCHYSHSVKELLNYLTTIFCIFSLEQDKKPQSASGGKKPSGKGFDSAKKDNPRSHHSSGKPTGPHPPHKKK